SNQGSDDVERWMDEAVVVRWMEGLLDCRR
ncbi:hypothetical protein Tco_0081172, partial [Tanacetum coccineum]